MPPPPSGGRGVPGPPNPTLQASSSSGVSKPISKQSAPPPQPSSSSSAAAASHQPPSLLGTSSSGKAPPRNSTPPLQKPTQSPSPSSSPAHPTNMTAESLANIDPEKKIAVLKKAILSLTKQKQDLEMTKNSLESKVTSLATQLAASDEKNAKLEHQNHDLQQQVESFAATARGAGRFTARAGSILKVFSGGDGAPGGAGTSPVSAASPTSEDQRLFEDNEALHIQLFEQRQQFDKKYKALEAEKSEQAMQLHVLEGVVASFQASDVAQSQQAEEAFKELQTEKAYNIRCMEIIRSDMVKRNNNTSSSAEYDNNDNSTSSSSTVQRIVGIYTDGLGEVLAAVSALMPHIPSNLAIFGVQSQSLEGERKKGLFTRQQKERLQALTVSHRTHRQQIQVEIGKVRDCFEGEGGVVGAGDLPNALVSLFTKVKEWLLFIHCNTTLILGPLDALRVAREKQHHHQRGNTTTTTTTLTALLQQIISFFIGEMAVVRDVIHSSTTTNTSSSPASTDISSSMIIALMCYREADVSTSTSTGTAIDRKTAASSMLFERFVYDMTRVLEAAAGGGSDVDPTNVLNRHYLTCIEQLVHSLGRSRKQLASALGLGTHVSSISTRIGAASNNTTNIPISSPEYSLNKQQPQDLLQKMLMANNNGGGGTTAADGSSDVIDSECSMGLAAIGTAADVWELVKSSDSNTRHHIANFQHAMTELARMHDLVDSLTQQSGSLLKDKEHMKKEYVSVVQIYESQIAMLSDRLAELTSGS